LSVATDTASLSLTREFDKMPVSDAFFPTLRYRDPAKAIEWLCRVLGFQRHFVAEDAGNVIHAQIRRGDSLIFLGPDHADDKYGMHSPLALNGTNQCVCVAISEDIDEHCAHAKASGAEIVTEPYDTPYGSREYTCRDIEGHIWCFGTYRGEPFE
jgi:uncharacterized glyoxalase superfamily protein PhnB